jgi:pimeloyl-ACP methyl ester carboxylesterase
MRSKRLGDMKFTVIAVDLRGVGHSAATPGGYEGKVR